MPVPEVGRFTGVSISDFNETMSGQIKVTDKKGNVGPARFKDGVVGPEDSFKMKKGPKWIKVNYRTAMKTYREVFKSKNEVDTEKKSWGLPEYKYQALVMDWLLDRAYACDITSLFPFFNSPGESKSRLFSYSTILLSAQLCGLESAKPNTSEAQIETWGKAVENKAAELFQKFTVETQRLEDAEFLPTSLQEEKKKTDFYRFLASRVADDANPARNPFSPESFYDEVRTELSDDPKLDALYVMHLIEVSLGARYLPRGSKVSISRTLNMYGEAISNNQELEKVGVLLEALRNHHRINDYSFNAQIATLIKEAFAEINGPWAAERKNILEQIVLRSYDSINARYRDGGGLNPRQIKF